MIMALWLSVMGVAQQTEEISIGTQYLYNNSNHPIWFNKKYSYNQTLIYADQIKLQGLPYFVNTIKFFKATGGECSRYIQVFIKHTDKNQFGSGDPFDSMNPDDLVYEGGFVVPEGENVWVTIDLDSPFYYDGVSNIILGINDMTGEVCADDITFWFDRPPVSVLPNQDPYTCTFLTFRYGNSGEGGGPFIPDPFDASSVPWAYIAHGQQLTVMKWIVSCFAGPVLEVIPNQIDCGDAPNGAWKHPQTVLIKNMGLSGVLNGVDATGDFFTVSGEPTPVDIPIAAQLNYQISTGSATPGQVNDNLIVTYSDTERETITIPLTANAYNPVSPDVFELAQSVYTYPYSDSPTQIFNTYALPGNNEDGPDGVYKMTFAEDVLLSANVENGANPKIALYKEDFGGGGGPHSDNAYTGPALPTPDAPQSHWIYYDDGTYAGAINTQGGAHWAIKITPDQLAQYQGCELDKVRLYQLNGVYGDLSLTIHMGGDDAPGSVVGSQDFSFDNTYGSWVEFDLERPVLLDVTQNLWLCFYCELSYGACFSAYCGDPNSCWCYDNGDWTTVADINDGVGVSWMVRAFVTNENGIREISTEGEINQMTVAAGTYYLVASSTDEGFQVNINTETIPLPQVANNPIPSNSTTGLKHPLKLRWNFGEFTTAYRLLFGTTNPPQDVVVDWTDVLDNDYLTGLLSNNTRYYWRVDERNSSGDTYGEVWQFTTTLDVPKDLRVDNDKLYEGEPAVLHWTPPTDRLFSYYNVYRNNVLLGNTTATSYTVENLAYNMTGYRFAVAAVYDVGESVKTEHVVVKVTGEGSVSGMVTEQDMVTPIVGATVKLAGLDEHGFPQLYQFVTDENGLYAGTVLAGTYNAAAMLHGYQSKILEDVTVQHQTNLQLNFMMDEQYSSVSEVLAEETGNTVTISWESQPNGSEAQWIQYDNGVYRDNIGYGGPMHWGVSFPDMSGFAGLKLTKIAYYDAVDMGGGNITANIYLGGLTAPQRLVSSEDFSTTGEGKLIEIALTTPVEIDGSEPLWITCYCENLWYPASGSADVTGDPNGRWISVDGETWVDLLMVNSQLHYSWMLRGYLEDSERDDRSLQHYNVYRANCYDDETAFYVASVFDTTFVDVAWPNIDMGVYKWGVSSVYQGNRETRGTQTLLNEDFEGGVLPEGWTRYGGSWAWTIASACANSTSFTPHSGNYAAFCNSDGESGTRYLVTPALDLTAAQSAALSFYYLLPDWSGDWDNLHVRYSTSSTGPWTNLWTAPYDTRTWTEKLIDLSDLCGGVYYLAFVGVDYWGYCSAVDDVTVTAEVYTPNLPHESDIVWSNCLNKDMTTSVEIEVKTSNALSPVGTKVVFLNISEPGTGYDYEVTLDETGRYVWEEFHKGDYRYAIELHGYESCADFDTISIWEPASLYCLLEELTYPVENLYVSPTGWAKWTDGFITQGDQFYEDFEDGSLGDWTLIDADGDGYNWKLGMQGGSPNIPGHNSAYCVYSESYEPSSGGLWPDNYLVSKRVAIGEGSVFSFYVCAQDEDWDYEHYGVAISTMGNTDPADFVTIWEETLSAKTKGSTPNTSRGSRMQGNWYYKEIDLSDYAGQEVYIALRHFNSFDVFCIDVDDIRLKSGRSAKAALRYKVMLDGVFVDNVEEQYLQHDVSSMVPGEIHTTTVAAVFATGISDWVSYEWTYVPCETFAGAENLSVDVEADAVTLHWTLPDDKQGKGSRDGQWYYYDDGVCIDAIGTEAGLSIYWGVMFPAGQYEGKKLTKVSMYNREGSEHEGNIMIYQGGSSAPEELLYTQPYEATGVNDFVEYDLAEPVVIDETRNLWIVMNNTTGTFVASACAPSPDPNSGWISLDGVTWDDIVNYGLYYSWMLRAYLETENYLGTMIWRDGELLTEIPIQGSTYLDQNVSTEWHEYCIRVVHAGMPDSTYYAMSCEQCELADVTGVGENLEDDVRIYPNPTSGEVTIKAEGMRWIRIVDMLGRKLFDQAVDGDEKTLNLSGFGSGVYVVNITTEKGVVNRRIVVDD